MRAKEQRFVASVYGAFWFFLGVCCGTEKFIYNPLQDPKKYDLSLLILGSVIVVISIKMTIINIKKLKEIKSGNPWFFFIVRLSLLMCLWQFVYHLFCK